jgi:hypothetical protein
MAILVTAVAAVLSVLAFALTVAWFWVASIPAAAFLVAFFLRGRGPALVATIVWALYGLWEALIQFRITCDAECNIRVDLFLTFPIVIAVSILAAWRTARSITAE